MSDSDMEMIDLIEPRPNNWYVHREKLNSILSVWSRGEESRLPPLLITRIDGELSLIDGHARALAAWRNGVSRIGAEYRALEAIEGSTELYIHIHREGPGRGIRTISDLQSRVLDPEEHKRLWIAYCDEWLKENSL